MNILVIDDEPLIAEAVQRILKNIARVNQVAIALNFRDGLSMASDQLYQLILIDICLGDGEYDGLDLCATIRQQQPDVSIIMTTSLRSLDCLEKAFEMGVNDYIKKPFHPKELQLRVQRWLGVQKRDQKARSLAYKNLHYDGTLHQFSWGSETLPLSKRNKDLLLIFLQRPETLLSHQYLEEHYWGDRSPRSHNLRATIRDLKLSLPEPCSGWIQSVRGEGYLLIYPNNPTS